MYVKEWFWYIVDVKEEKFYRLYQELWRLGMIDKKPTPSNKFRQLERIIKDIRIMAQNAKNKRKPSPRVNNELRWISVSLNDEDQAACDAWLDANVSQCLGYLCNIAERGFSCSLKPGRDEDYMATIFGDVGTSEAPDAIGVSAFAADPGDALAGVLYKFIVILDMGKSVPSRDDATKRRFR